MYVGDQAFLLASKPGFEDSNPVGYWHIV